ncbi:hypothetical protein CALVIDRAFT_205970 [Calocera viscosa TUFC12733]|uniref:Uncharacterized protein n=1 Tax=Calocera viscosa (strain TUFC12733) TaxID=1330018 RepID=A0A167KEN4_CALVF|nr:hypothetical protein CALVIDRAFT_205970 [Calocera viscosa TUFC12733]
MIAQEQASVPRGLSIGGLLIVEQEKHIWRLCARCWPSACGFKPCAQLETDSAYRLMQQVSWDLHLHHSAADVAFQHVEALVQEKVGVQQFIAAARVLSWQMMPGSVHAYGQIDG